MRVKLKTLMAGPEGSAHPGQILDLPADRAQALVAGGYADAMEPEAQGTQEAATLATPETAMQPAARKRR